MKVCFLSTLALVVGFCALVAQAEEPRLRAEGRILEGSYSPDNLGKNWFASTATGLRFRLSYLDTLCEVLEYRLRREGTLLVLERLDRANSCAKSQVPFVLKGEIENLASGNYQLRVERKTDAGSVLVPYEKEVVVGGRW